MTIDPNSPAPIEPRAFAIPAKLHLFLIFMLQLISFLLILAVLPWMLQADGLAPWLAWTIAVIGIVVAHLLLGALGRMLPVRCTNCRGRARYRGAGWWPFIYWYDCGSCGAAKRLEVRGR